MSAATTARAMAEVLNLIGGLGGVAAIITAAVGYGKLRVETRHTARQLVPNGGGSLRDAVDRIERDIGGIRADIRQHSQELENVRAQLHRRHHRPRATIRR